MLAAGVALSHIYHDVGVSGASGTNSRRGWHSLDSRLAQGDTLVVVSIDRIGRRWLDTMGNIHGLQRRGVRIRSLADCEQSWAQYLDADPDSTPYQGGFGEGEGGQQENGRSPLVARGAGGAVIEMAASGSASGASPGPTAYRLRQSGAP